MTSIHTVTRLLMVLGFVLCWGMTARAQTRSIELHTFEATGLEYGPSEKEFRAAAVVFAPNVLVSIDARISEVQIIAMTPFDLGGFLEMAQQYGIVLSPKPVEELPEDQ